jgi:hypothetical protein
MQIFAMLLNNFYSGTVDFLVSTEQTQQAVACIFLFQASKTSLKDRITGVQDTLAQVQNSLDFIASLMERVRK